MRRIVICVVGALVGHIIGWFAATAWATLSGNLMMPAPEYERRGADIRLVFYGIIGLCTLLGLLASFIVRTRPRP